MDFPFQPAGSGFGAVEGYLFGDINKDDALDAGDYRFDGVNVTVTWTTADGKNGSETVTTDANGYYVTSFDIPSVAATGGPSTVTVSYDAATIIAGGFTTTLPAGSYAYSTNPVQVGGAVSSACLEPATPRLDMGGAADPEG